MADHEHTRQRFEDHCWQHYMAERERRDMPGDVPDAFPTREQLFWRMPDGRYGVLMFNAAWLAWCWAMDIQPVIPAGWTILRRGDEIVVSAPNLNPGMCTLSQNSKWLESRMLYRLGMSLIGDAK